MANQTYVSGPVTVTSTAALAFTVPSGCGASGVLVANTGTVTVYLGGPGVTSATGFPITAATTPPGPPVTLPTNGAEAHDVWAVVASTSGSISFLYPVP